MSGETKQRISELEAEIARLKAAQPTLRDQFAMAAIPLVGSRIDWKFPNGQYDVARASYDIADAMLWCRENNTQKV
jgi:hypothetical protein